MDYYLISATGLSVSIHVNIQKCLGPLNLLVVMSYIKLLLHLVKIVRSALTLLLNDLKTVELNF